MSQKKILIIGSGGREHAIAHKLIQQSEHFDNINKIFVAPGNAGTALLPKTKNIELNDIAGLKQFALENSIDLTIVGPEALLAEGIVDEFNSSDLKIFGPHKKAAKLESSKAYAKEFMKKYGIKTADYERFDSAENAIAHLDKVTFPTVIKADGLAAGKGVVIAENYEQAKSAIEEIMLNKCFADAGNVVVIEEFLTGVEASILSFTDSNVILPTVSAKDHKKIGEGETGLNTGGMGVIAPNPYVTDSVFQEFIDYILAPTLTGIQAENINFNGVIFFGLMINEKGVYLLEYNIRFGDPETQAVLPLMQSSLLEVIERSIDKKLSDYQIDWDKKYSCCVVAAAKGYPEQYEKGQVISGYEQMDDDALCFIAGANLSSQNEVLTCGGRVLNVVGVGATAQNARQTAYKNMEKVIFSGKTLRSDIGKVD